MQGLARLFPVQLEDLKAGTELCHPLSQLLFLATGQKIVAPGEPGATWNSWQEEALRNRDRGAWGGKNGGRRFAIALIGVKRVLLTCYLTALSQVSLQVLWGEAVGDRLGYGPAFRAAG